MISAGVANLFLLRWESRIDRLIRIRADVQVRAMVIGIIAFLIKAVSSHELDDLQGAFRAIDVGEFDVGLDLFFEPRDVLEEAIRDYRRQGRILNHP